MQVSILIVSRNRKAELEYTLKVLRRIIDISLHEVLVFLDGCSDSSSELKLSFPEVNWFETEKSLGASPARNKLYQKAKGSFLIGLDDDAHPLNIDFIEKTLKFFSRYPNVGIIAFEEVKGVFKSDEEALRSVGTERLEYVTNEFIGCGFAIRKDVYKATNGFPVWMDIYGEESCLSIEVLSKGYDILYTNQIKINHRVNKEVRKLNRQNYFRFGKQLKNSTYYFLVYYPFPFVNILKLYYHNFRKYALTDWNCCKIYFKTIFVVLFDFVGILKYRKPVDKSLLVKMRTLSSLKF